MIQIGMNCDPEWLCDTLAGGIGLLVMLGIVGLIRVILRERKKRKKTYVIKPHDRGSPGDDH